MRGGQAEGGCTRGWEAALPAAQSERTARLHPPAPPTHTHPPEAERHKHAVDSGGRRVGAHAHGRRVDKRLQVQVRHHHLRPRAGVGRWVWVGGCGGCDGAYASKGGRTQLPGKVQPPPNHWRPAHLRKAWQAATPLPGCQRARDGPQRRRPRRCCRCARRSPGRRCCRPAGCLRGSARGGGTWRLPVHLRTLQHRRPPARAGSDTCRGGGGGIRRIGGWWAGATQLCGGWQQQPQPIAARQAQSAGGRYNRAGRRRVRVPAVRVAVGALPQQQLDLGPQDKAGQAEGTVLHGNTVWSGSKPHGREAGATRVLHRRPWSSWQGAEWAARCWQQCSSSAWLLVARKQPDAPGGRGCGGRIPGTRCAGCTASNSPPAARSQRRAAPPPGRSSGALPSGRAGGAAAPAQQMRRLLGGCSGLC